MNYKCYYEGKDFFHTEIVDALTPEDAAKTFEILMQEKNIDPEQYVRVEIEGISSNESYKIKSIGGQEIIRKDHEERLQFFQGEAEQIKNISFLELPAEKRDSFYQAVSYLSAQLEVRALEKEEIEFLKAWHQLKDRELGEALLTKNEMSKPPSQQGKSAFSKTAWAAGFAMQGMASQNTLNDIADDVSDISDGGGGFD